MVLPNKFATYDEYFSEALDFLKKNRHIYNYANVDVLTNNILNIIKNDNDLNSFVSNSNEYIKYYNGSTDILKMTDHQNDMRMEGEELYNHISMRGLSKKKIHEIYKLSDKINHECERLNVMAVIDLGSGLGYLSQLLNAKFGYRVIGVEGDVRRVEGAVNRQKKYFERSQDSVHYIHKFITHESASHLSNKAEEFFINNENFILAGLHACGDLTVDAIRLFLNMDRCKGLIIMPCCYHKMKEIKSTLTMFSDSAKFINIPLSSSMHRAYQVCKADTYLRQPFLRLSCQRSQRAWEDDVTQHRARIFHLMSRAILQLYARNENLKLVKKKRRAVSRIKSNQCDFASFLKDAITNGYTLKRTDSAGNSFTTESNYTSEDDDKTRGVPGEASVLKETEVMKGKCNEKTSIDFDEDKILSLWNDLTPDDFKAADLLMHLQDGMQAFCENIVLLDKLAYLEEHRIDLGMENLIARFEKVTDETISPRCNALVATKL